MLIRNFHARSLPATPDQLGRLVDALAGPDDPLWPVDHWPAMRFDRPLGVGADGGHGSVRYTVVGYIPGEWIRFQFNGSGGLVGFHEVTVRPDGPHHAELSHLLAATARGRELLRWALVMRWLHDVAIEEMLDRAEFATAGTVRDPIRWNPHVRLLRRVMRRRTPAARVSPVGV
ncbi:SRPBCC family protein [Rhodococcus maanshanensis]|uniref:SRPBCC family protein n=1 Tax=Rhodococcus maanshanensis TaxID=183556 RepID=UPI0022B4293F|nr:SRPBCC family protein [Rhodococcus maanshanensis]MCZ4557875.1 SRPBCC family protein [Rhodococcus maanshanensis]